MRAMRASSELTPAQIGMLVVGYVLLAVTAYFYLASGLVVPGPWLFVLWAVMLVLIFLSIRWRRRPTLVLALPFVAGLFWLAFVQGLGSIFDWTA
jgi:hypothetical protein